MDTTTTKQEEKAATTPLDPATPGAAPAQGDTAKVRIKRVAGADPITGFSYTPFRTAEMDAQPHSNGMRDFHPDPNQDVFEVSADIATAAVETGGFEVEPSSRVQLTGSKRQGGE